jgi:hypothetical protein
MERPFVVLPTSYQASPEPAWDAGLRCDRSLLRRALRFRRRLLASLSLLLDELRPRLETDQIRHFFVRLRRRLLLPRREEFLDGLQPHEIRHFLLFVHRHVVTIRLGRCIRGS